MRRRLAAGAAAAALAAGCGGGADPAPAPAPQEQPEALGSGYFVGTTADGVGATVDLVGGDPVVRALDAALRQDAPPSGPAPAVGIASMVNGSPAPVRAPTFTAVLTTGELIPLRDAREALGDRADPLARRARALLAPARRALPAGDSAVAYLVLRGVVPGRVAEVRMRAGAGASARLAPRPR